MVAKRKLSPMDVAIWIIATPVYWKLVLSTARPGKVSLAQRKRSAAGICSKARSRR